MKTDSQYYTNIANAINEKIQTPQAFTPPEMVAFIRDHLKYVKPIPAFENANWEDVYKVCLASSEGKVDLTQWAKIGSVKRLNLKSSILGDSFYDMRVIGINHDRPNSITFESVKPSTAGVFSSAAKSWNDGQDDNHTADIKLFFRDQFLPVIPDEVKNHILELPKFTAMESSKSKYKKQYRSKEKVWICSTDENNIKSYSYGSESSYTDGGKRDPYEFYKNGNTPTLQGVQVWLRNGHNRVLGKGYIPYEFALDSTGKLREARHETLSVCPCFTIGVSV